MVTVDKLMKEYNLSYGDIITLPVSLVNLELVMTSPLIEWADFHEDIYFNEMVVTLKIVDYLIPQSLN